MSRRGAVLAGSRAVGTTGRAGVVGQPPGPGASPLARELATGMGLPVQGTAGWGDTYGGYGLPRPASTFTDGAFSPFTPTVSVPVDVADASGQPPPRREEYRVGWNLPVGQPGTEGLKLADFNTLRTIADLYSVARACIEFLKSQITSLEWEIMPTKDAAKAMRGDKAAMKDFGERRAQAVKFFKRPDPDYFSWQTWLSDVLEEMLVYDALSVVVREKWGKGQGRGVLGSDLDCLNLISGPTVRPLYDLNGSRPRPPAVAYQQYLYGVPRVDLWSMVTERDLDESGLRGSEMRQFGGTQLLYVPMTPRRWTPYGFSPVERALVPIMTGLQKQAYQLDYFREGTIPGIFVSPGGANADMSPTQIRELQNALNAIAGDPAWKHKILVLPADSRVDPMRPTAVADALDEIVMMQTCMGFGVFPMQVGIMPKVSASQASGGAQNQMAKMGNQQQDRSTTRPKVIFLATLMDYIMTEVCNQDDMRFVFDGMEEEEDEETKTNLIVNQMSHGLLTIDEGRDELGKQPFGEPKTSDPGWGTATGFQTFQEAEEQAQQQAANAQAMAQNGAVPGGQPGAPGAPKAPPAAGGGAAAKPKPSKPGAGGAGQSPGHEAAESASNATRTPAKGDGVSGAPSPKTKAATATATSTPAAEQAPPPDDPQALRDLVVAAVALGVSQALAGVVKRFRNGALSLADAVQAGLAVLARGYGNVMAMAAEKAWTDGLGDRTAPDLSGPVARRAEAQRPYLTHLLDKARLDDAPADDTPSWLPARVNLYAATLHGAYQEGYGTAVQQAHPEYELVWRLGEAEHCPLCLERDGQSYTFDTLPGWPGDGGFGGADALCLGGQNCRCSLDFVQNGDVLDSAGNTLEQAGYYAQQNQAIAAWRADALASTNAFLSQLPNETGADGVSSVQSRAMAREAVRRRLASLLNQRVQATGGYPGVSFEPSDIPASMVASILPQYGPYPDDVPLTALMDAVDQFFAMKGARLDLTKTELAGIVLGVVRDAMVEPIPTSVVDKRAARAELEACARQLSKGRAWREWVPRSVDADAVAFLAARLDAGDDRKAAVAKALARWVDTGGQVHEPGDDEAESPVNPVLEGDAAGWGGPVLQAHDAAGIYHSGSGPRVGSAVKGASDPHDPNPVEAEHVYGQLLENYPAKALRWVRKASWIGPVEVPVDRVDTDDEASWAASHQPARVDHFAAQLEDGQAVKPAVCVQEPGESRVKVVDGHHRYLGAVQAGKKTFKAYVGFVRKNGGAWDETHVYQFHAGQDPQNKGGGAPAFKVDTDPKATERLRRYWSHGEGAAKIGWGTPGDFDRCVLHVGKFMDNPQGYCAERHHDALGIWPATHAAELRGKKVLKGKQAPPAAAGLAVRARDTGRVLMLQRAVDGEDPAGGTWEFPGGRLEPGESALAAARREWGEETGLEPPSAGPVGAWTGSNGVYHGYVVEVPSEADLDVFGDREDVENPDGDAVEALAWWDPEDLSGNSVVRDELRADANLVRGALGAYKGLGVADSTGLFTLLATLDKVDTVGSDVDEDGGAVGIDGVIGLHLSYGIVTKAEALELLKFDPEEPRDPKGKWVHGLSELEHVVDSAAKKPVYHTAGGNVHADVLSVKKDGTVVHKPTGTTIGKIERVPVPGTNLKSYHTTHANGVVSYNGLNKKQALVALAAHHNAAYAEDHAPKLEAPKPAYHAAGAAVTAKELVYKKDGTVVHGPSGKQLGTITRVEDPANPKLRTYRTVHADGTQVYDGYKRQEALDALAKHHEYVVSAAAITPPSHAIAAPKPVEKPAVAAVEPTVATPTAPKPYETVGHVELSAVHNEAKAGHADVVHNETGAKIGQYKLNDWTHKYDVAHADGTQLPSQASFGGIKPTLLAYHNEKYGDAAKLEPTVPKAPAKKVAVAPPKKPYETVGQVTEANASQHWDGDGFDVKKNGVVVGHVSYEPSDDEDAEDGGYWHATHADGTPVGSEQKEHHAVEILLEHHNEKYGTPKPATVAPAKKTATAPPKLATDWAKAGKLPFGGATVNGQWDAVDKKTGTVIGHVTHKPSDGGAANWEITHGSGDKVTAKDLPTATVQLVNLHNAKVDAGAVAPAKTYQDVGHVKLTDVKLTGWPGDQYVHQPTGAVLGTKDSDGFTFHANGLPVATPSDGALTATQKLVQYHNTKVAEGVVKPSLTVPASASEKPTWANAGAVKLSDVHTAPTEDGAVGVYHSATGTKVGQYTVLGIGDVDAQHADYSHVGDFAHGSDAVDAIIQAHNEKVTALGGPSADETPDWVGVGKLGSALGTKLHSNGDVSDPSTGTVIGSVKQNAVGYYDVTHASGFGAGPKPTKIGAMQALVDTHNEKVDQWHADQGDQLATAAGEAKPAWHAAGDHVAPEDLKYDPHTDEVTHVPTGVKLGTAAKDDAGVWQVTHPSGATAEADNMTDAKENLAGLHNDVMAGHAPTSTSTPSAPAAPVAKPAWHQAGAAVHPSDVVVKKDGSVVHKGTGHVLGTVTKPGDGTWKAEHADGTPFTYNSTRAVAVKKLLNYHNQTVAVQGAVQPGQKADWVDAGHLGQGYYNGPKLQPNGDVHAPNGKKIGHVEISPTGSFTVTHESGATFQSNGGQSDAVLSIGHAHNQAVHLANGTTPPKPASTTPYNAFAPKPKPEAEKQPYEKLGTISPGSLYSANVQKDPEGKITGSDMTTGAGVVVGHTAANPDGTVKVTHADGHVVVEKVTVGTGQVSGKLAEYHNSKYGDATLPAKPKPAAASAATAAPAHVVSTYTETSAPVTHEEKTALKQYTGSAYEAINDKLRDQKLAAETRPSNKVPGLMHDGIEKSRLKQDTVLYRGIGSAGDKLFGPVGSKVGKEATEYGFVSTSVNPNKAFYGTRMVIHAPKGTHAMDVKSFSHYGHEEEVLLQHGTRFHVNSDQLVNGQRVVDVTVVGPL